MPSHVMIDLETLGTTPGSVILSIGAVAFGAAGVSATFYRVINVFDSLMCGLAIDPATVAWWSRQSDGAKAPLIHGPSVPLTSALNDLREFLSEAQAEYLWAKGPDFDLVLLDAAYRAIGATRPWSFRNARDVRTLLALSPPTDHGRAGVIHDALADATHQAGQVIAAYARLGLAL